jgi:hypothetical protein
MGDCTKELAQKHILRMAAHRIECTAMAPRKQLHVSAHSTVSGTNRVMTSLDDITDEIMASFRSEDNPALVAGEPASYLPSAVDEPDDELQAG